MLSEADVQKECITLLRHDRRVAWVARINSGSKGHIKFCYMYDIEKMPDVVGQLNDGTFFAFEIKKPSWGGVKEQGKTATDLREQKQQRTLKTISDNGGVADFIRDAIQCKWAIDSHYIKPTYGV